RATASWPTLPRTTCEAASNSHRRRRNQSAGLLLPEGLLDVVECRQTRDYDGLRERRMVPRRKRRQGAAFLLTPTQPTEGRPDLNRATVGSPARTRTDAAR